MDGWAISVEGWRSRHMSDLQPELSMFVFIGMATCALQAGEPAWTGELRYFEKRKGLRSILAILIDVDKLHVQRSTSLNCIGSTFSISMPCFRKASVDHTEICLGRI
jgi:hypothetical protein